MNNTSSAIYTAVKKKEPSKNITVELDNCHDNESLRDYAHRVLNKKSNNDTSPLFNLYSTILKQAHEIDTKQNLVMAILNKIIKNSSKTSSATILNIWIKIPFNIQCRRTKTQPRLLVHIHHKYNRKTI